MCIDRHVNIVFLSSNIYNYMRTLYLYSFSCIVFQYKEKCYLGKEK